jgi:hypothetical protein
MATIKKKVGVKTPVKSSISRPTQALINKTAAQQGVKLANDTAKAIDTISKAVKRDTSRNPDTSKMTSELANIDFRKMIGGPLQAAVDAQVASSLASIDFINQVGFKNTGSGPTATRELVYVDFTHDQIEITPSADGKTSTEKSIKKFIKVPLLTMVQIPSLRIEYVDINFKAKLNSVESRDVSEKLDVKADLKVGWGPVSLKISASYQRQSTTGVKIEKEYALDIKVRAVQDEIPRGLEEIFGMLK